MPCRQVSTYNGSTGSGQSGGGGYATEAECNQACKEGACCEGTSCTVKPQCQCQCTTGRCCGPDTVTIRNGTETWPVYRVENKQACLARGGTWKCGEFGPLSIEGYTGTPLCGSVSGTTEPVFKGVGTTCAYPNGVSRCSCRSCVYECNGVFIQAAVFTLRIVIEPYSALISFPPCPDDGSIVNRTYSTQRADFNYVFPLAFACGFIPQFSINPESNLISGSSRPVYLPGFAHTLEFGLSNECVAGLKIYSGAGQSRFVCSENYTMFRNHRHTDDPVLDGGFTKYAYDIVRSSETSAQVSCLSDLIGMTVSHQPIPNPDCTTAINGPFGIVYPTDGSYKFCESGGGITAEIIDVQEPTLP